MAIISYYDLSSVKIRHPGQKVVFCSGSFDLLHPGHIAFFENCKKYGEVLVVALGRDEDIRKNKGPDRPVLNERARLKVVDSLKVVDYSFLSKPTAPGAGRLHFLTEIFADLKPDIWIANFDETTEELRERQEFSEHSGIPLLVLDRAAPPELEKPSTTDLIKKIRGPY
jgi:D-beta-D-heptose 7-phosphate kinase/D-beta-D-heptose 1-phosphate adenosyltransferase